MDGKTKGCLAAVVVTVVGGTLLCGCSGIVAVLWGPGWALSTIVQDVPSDFEAVLDTQSTAEQTAERVGAELTQSRTTRVTAAQLNTLASDAIGDEEAKVAFTFDGDHGLMEFSGNMGDDDEQAWVNGALGGTFVIEKGWFTSADIDVARLGSWDVGGQIAGNPIAPDLNRSMADQRSQNPDVAVILDAIEMMTVENDGLTLTTNENWEAALEAMANQ